MPDIRGGYAPSRYGQIHYRIVVPDQAVTAPPLLCLHQTPSSSRDWIPVLPALGRNRVVIAADTPGYGMSDAPPEPAAIEDFSEIMVDLMNDLATLGVVPAVPFDVMGFHTGSVIAADIARRHPQRVRRLVLFGLAAWPAERRAATLAALLENFPAPDASLRHVEALWAIIGELGDPRVPAEDRHVHMAECLRLGARMPWGYVSVFGYDFLDTLSVIGQDTLVINPQDDLWEVTGEVAHLLRAGTRYDIPGVAHGVLALETERVVGRIEEFLG